jgi:ribosome-associated protein YbcJ (S4-like RNA binding protein)
MAKLIIKFNDVVIDQIVLKQGDVTVGRRPGSDIVLDNMAVSGNHASLFTIGDDSFIQDLNSTNGTLVNGKKITKHHLANGDVVSIGQHSLLYVNEKAARPSDNLAKTVIITAPPSVEAPPPAAAAAPSSAPAGASIPDTTTKEPKGSLFVLSGANSGKRIDLTMSITNLGKGGKRAGSIVRGARGYLLQPGDEGMLLKLNGKALPPKGEDLKNGDIIEIADARMQFYLK